MHHPVDGVEVRRPPQGHGGRHQEVGHWSIGEVGIVGESTGGPGIAQPCLQARGQDAGQGGEGGIVHQLGGGRVCWGDLVAGEPVPERGEVEDPVPEATDGPGGGQVPGQEGRGPGGRGAQGPAPQEPGVAWTLGSNVQQVSDK